MRKTVTVAFAVTTLLALSAPLCAAVPKSAAPAKPAGKPSSGPVGAWVIKQKMDYQGPIEITANDDGAVIKTRTLCVYMKANSSEATLINESNKTRSTVDRRLWMDNKTVVVHEVIPEKLASVAKKYDLTLEGPRQIAGHKCKQHWAAAFKHDKSFWFWWEYWAPEDIKLPKKMANEYRAMFHMPPGDTLPLLANRYFTDRSPRQVITSTGTSVWLSTQEATHKNVLASTFVAPTVGYKAVGDEIDALMAQPAQGDDEIDKIFGTTGGGRKK